MKVQNEEWQIAKFKELELRIDPKPQYQRGDVWSPSKKQLLVDSILSNYDIPKVYLRKVVDNALYDYEVADGQQRLKAIWGYINKDYALDASPETNSEWRGKKYDELTQNQRYHILSFSLIVAVIGDDEDDEIRELFARLQKGVTLTPPEIRNSMRSVIGNVIRGMAESHRFFKNGPISENRYNRSDYLAHAFALELYRGERDIKAPDLREMYIEYKNKINDDIAKKVNAVLNIMHDMQVASPKCIRTKWGFVDLYWLISQEFDLNPDAKKLATAYKDFEQKRLKYVHDPLPLIVKRGESDRALYNYIIAFKNDSGTAKNLG